MQLSDKGFDALDREEGDVLRAYRDVAGHWTISRGLTAASGVVTPKAGMVISQADSDRLTRLALARNYEPTVERVMKPGDPQQHEFDAGVLFHWNTGAIGRATWVALWLKEAAWASIEPAFKVWNKAGGKVVGGLVRRREREFTILRYGQYPTAAKKLDAASGWTFARIAAPVTASQVPDLRTALAGLGYAVGTDAGKILDAALRQFQKDHDLTVDGILGRATAATIQRRIDAGKKVTSATAIGGTTAAAGSIEIASPMLTDPQPWLGALCIAAAIALVAWRAWQYRDAIAVKVQRRLPRLAAYLRSF